jgi:hypothetical protein
MDGQISPRGRSWTYIQRGHEFVILDETETEIAYCYTEEQAKYLSATPALVDACFISKDALTAAWTGDKEMAAMSAIKGALDAAGVLP